MNAHVSDLSKKDFFQEDIKPNFIVKTEVTDIKCEPSASCVNVASCAPVGHQQANINAPLFQEENARDKISKASLCLQSVLPDYLSGKASTSDKIRGNKIRDRVWNVYQYCKRRSRKQLNASRQNYGICFSQHNSFIGHYVKRKRMATRKSVRIQDLIQQSKSSLRHAHLGPPSFGNSLRDHSPISITSSDSSDVDLPDVKSGLNDGQDISTGSKAQNEQGAIDTPTILPGEGIDVLNFPMDHTAASSDVSAQPIVKVECDNTKTVPTEGSTESTARNCVTQGIAVNAYRRRLCQSPSEPGQLSSEDKRLVHSSVNIKSADSSAFKQPDDIKEESNDGQGVSTEMNTQHFQSTTNAPANQPREGIDVLLLPGENIYESTDNEFSMSSHSSKTIPSNISAAFGKRSCIRGRGCRLKAYEKYGRRARHTDRCACRTSRERRNCSNYQFKRHASQNHQNLVTCLRKESWHTPSHAEDFPSENTLDHSPINISSSDSSVIKPETNYDTNIFTASNFTNIQENSDAQTDPLRGDTNVPIFPEEYSEGIVSNCEKSDARQNHENFQHYSQFRHQDSVSSLRRDNSKHSCNTVQENVKGHSCKFTYCTLNNVPQRTPASCLRWDSGIHHRNTLHFLRKHSRACSHSGQVSSERDTLDHSPTNVLHSHSSLQSTVVIKTKSNNDQNVSSESNAQYMESTSVDLVDQPRDTNTLILEEEHSTENFNDDSSSTVSALGQNHKHFECNNSVSRNQYSYEDPATCLRSDSRKHHCNTIRAPRRKLLSSPTHPQQTYEINTLGIDIVSARYTQPTVIISDSSDDENVCTESNTQIVQDATDTPTNQPRDGIDVLILPEEYSQMTFSDITHIESSTSRRCHRNFQYNNYVPKSQFSRKESNERRDTRKYIRSRRPIQGRGPRREMEKDTPVSGLR